MKTLSKPKRCILEITYRCNLFCRTCSLWTNTFKKNHTQSFLPIKDIKTIQQRIADNGIARITYLGGEPFMHPDILCAAEHAKKLKLRTAVVTNGTLMHDPVCAELVKKQLFDIIIFSIDGPEHIHDTIRGKPGAFKKALDALVIIRKQKNVLHMKNPKIYIYTTISRFNYAYADAVFTIAQHCGVNRLKCISASHISTDIIERTNKVFNGVVIKDHNYAVTENIKIPHNAIDRVSALMRSITHRSKITGIPFDCERYLLNGTSNLPCKFLHKDFIISSSGAVYPCPMLPEYSLGNIYTDSLDALYKTKKMAFLRSLAAQNKLPICGECCV